MSMSLQRKPEPLRGVQFRKIRESLGLTRDDVSKGTGYSERQIARWELENGRVREVVRQYLLNMMPHDPTAPGSFRFIDLFAGIGGFRLGLNAAGGQCVFTSEWNDWAATTYRANFGDHQVHGDITRVAPPEIPDHDVLAAGFPCQPFSIAGVSKKKSLGRKHGFEDETQGTLFFNLAKIIEAKQPRAFVLENVKNLASHDRGRTFAVIMHTLRKELGYRVEARIIDAQRFVPQHRERIFIVGLHADLGATFDFDDVLLPDLKKGPRLFSILHPEDGSEGVDPRFLTDKGRVLPKYVLTTHLWTYLQNYARKHQAAGNGFGFGLVGPDDIARTLSARYYKDGSEILVRRRRGNPRRLTPRECARLMGFDRPGKQPFRIVVSDTQAYKQFGNAVAVPVVEAIAKALRPYLAGERKGAGVQVPLGLDAA